MMYQNVHTQMTLKTGYKTAVDVIYGRWQKYRSIPTHQNSDETHIMEYFWTVVTYLI